VSETITNAGAAGQGIVVAPEAASMAVPTPEQRVAAATAAAFRTDPTPTPAAPGPAPVAEPAPQPTLAETIRAAREARQAAQAETQKRTGLESELKAAREELARVRADRQAFEDDPVGYAKARGWTQEQQLLYGKSLLFDLAPDKADPDFRIKMFEDRQKREKAAQEREAKVAKEREEQESAQRQIQEYEMETAQAVRGFESGSYPESEAWFEGDFDSYMTSLMATARNEAARATKEGRVADLTAPALARVLEAEVARRMAARDQRKQTRTPAQPAAAPPPAVGGKQPIETLSTKNMHGTGTPRPPATSEKERIQRAIEAGWSGR
jgi:hypothetical protein